LRSPIHRPQAGFLRIAPTGFRPNGPKKKTGAREAGASRDKVLEGRENLKDQISR
jgi:hypothetical protein